MPRLAAPLLTPKTLAMLFLLTPRLLTHKSDSDPDPLSAALPHRRSLKISRGYPLSRLSLVRWIVESTLIKVLLLNFSSASTAALRNNARDMTPGADLPLISQQREAGDEQD
jgi:hypothetical protein